MRRHGAFRNPSRRRCTITIRIHPIRTGSVKVRTAQRERRAGGPLRVLTDSEWTDWLPILAWLIDHPEGPIVVDTGETARTAEPDWFPAWHPYYRRAVQFDVEPEQEIGPQLRALGLEPTDVRRLVLTHLHTDHAGGLHHFPGVEILVSHLDWKQARGLGGRLRGYLPQHWPSWFDPASIPFASDVTFETWPLTSAGDVRMVRTPGHTPGHISVIVESDGIDYLLAGDTSYTQRMLLRQRPDGVSLRPGVTLRTMDRILAHAAERPTVYLPTHDPESVTRLERNILLAPTALRMAQSARAPRVPARATRRAS